MQWLLPFSDSLASRDRRLLHVAAALMLAILAGTTLVAAFQGVTGIGGEALEAPVRDWAPQLAYLLVAWIVGLRAWRVSEGRLAWAAISLGLALYAVGNIVYTFIYQDGVELPVPALSDAFWLALYPLSYLGIALLAREDSRRLPAGVWLDGIIAGFGVAALGAAVVFGQVLRNSADGLDAAGAVTTLAYPVADFLLAALVIGVLSLRGWRLDRTWAMLGGGFLALWLADSIFLVKVANGAVTSSMLANVFYLGGVAMLALAAWQPRPAAQPPKLEGWSVLVAPSIFSSVALALLMADHFLRLNDLAVMLAIATLVAAFVRAILTFRDMREFAVTRYQAVTDDLTSLPNRRLFLTRAEEAIADARESGNTVALLVVDLDHFKELNDTLGHHAGDVILRQIGPRLNGVVRATDTVARLSGDEFGIVLGPGDAAVALRVADKVRSALTESFEVRDMGLHVSACVGIALCPDHGEDVEELLQKADVAMYQAKTAGTGREIYAYERDTHSRERLALIGDLRLALDRGELEAFFQPKVDAVDRHVVGMEALVRWRHPERGLLAPAEFLPLAEQAGLARPLTREVLEQALRQCRAWLDEGIDVQVSVNMTAPDLLDAQLPNEVGDALDRYGLPPSALVIEITESSVLADPVRIGQVLDRLDKRGIGLSLDDFGTGYSSLTHLKALPVREVKIDRGFVASMESNGADRAIVSSTIGLAHELGMRVVAEGVEDETTWALLEGLGCELIQGYAFSRPLPAEELAHLIEGAPVPG
jgi:diguanylate cyclase (GGDEF)-like protein